MLTLSLVKGTSRDYVLQVNNPDGTPAVNLFLPTDVIASRIWRGDAEIIILSPLTTWVSAPLGTFQVSFNDIDTQQLGIGQYRIQSTASRAGRTAVLIDGLLEIDEAPGAAVPTDLIAHDYLASCLADLGLTDTQRQVLPQLLQASSRLIRKHCNRWFNRRPSSDGSLSSYDGLYTVDWPSRTVLLRQFPVNGIVRVRTSPTQVFNVTNGNPANQQATATLATTGVSDIDDVPPVVTGMSLWSISSAVPTSVNLSFATYKTLAALAGAINALGNGWQATIPDATYANWPTSDFRSGLGPSSAIGQFQETGFYIHTQDSPVELDQKAGIIAFETRAGLDPFKSYSFGPYLATDLGDLQVYGGTNGVRVTYDAGWDTVPEDVQQACVETVHDMLNLLKIDQRLQSETAGDYSYALAPGRYALPPSVIGKLGYYRNIRT